MASILVLKKYEKMPKFRFFRSVKVKGAPFFSKAKIRKKHGSYCSPHSYGRLCKNMDPVAQKL